jgi:hypothetical protein
VEPLRPVQAAAQRVPVSLEAAAEAPSAAWARQVRSVLLPALPVSAFRPAAAQPTGRRPMARPRAAPARTEALEAGRGAISWRPLLPRRSPARISCARCISGAISSRARRIALRQRTARNCRSTSADDANVSGPTAEPVLCQRIQKRRLQDVLPDGDDRRLPARRVGSDRPPPSLNPSRGPLTSETASGLIRTAVRLIAPRRRGARYPYRISGT